MKPLKKGEMERIHEILYEGHKDVVKKKKLEDAIQVLREQVWSIDYAQDERMSEIKKIILKDKHDKYLDEVE